MIREFPNGETHLRSLLFRRDDPSMSIWRHTLDGRRRGVGRALAWAASNRKVCGRRGGLAIFGLAEIKRRYSFLNQIGNESEPGELKHLSTRRKGHQRDSVSSGERTRTRPMLLLRFTRTGWKAGPQRVTAPYGYEPVEDSSRAGHVQSCLNMGGPPSKPKYSSATDSEQVP